MNHIENVAKRLKGLRDALDLSVTDISVACNIDEATYKRYEEGNSDIPVSFLHRLAHKYGVELTALLFDEEPRMNSYFVTRKGKGVSVERTKAYRYQSLAAGFVNRALDPFMVSVEPNDAPVHLNTHPGQEFNYVVEGRMEFTIGGNTIIMEAG
ncbi:MAG: XRE family transcriptional regulator, partial [Muribaculaceae bacterium]